MQAQYTYQELKKMSLTKLESIDILDGPTEKLVQQVIDEKRMALPLSSGGASELVVPDILTKEDEDKWQAKLDEHRAKKRGIKPDMKVAKTEVNKPEMKDEVKDKQHAVQTKVKTDDVFKCDKPECNGKEFDSKKGLDLHTRVKHSQQ